MKPARTILQFLLLLCPAVPAQSPDSASVPTVQTPSTGADSTGVANVAAPDSAGTADVAIPDSAAQAPKSDDSFSNPFAADAVPAADTMDYSSNPMHNPAMHRSGIMTGVGSQKPLLDLLLDIAIGYSQSRFSIESPFYSSRGQGDFLFNIGIILPIRKLFFAEIAVSNMQLKYTITDSTADNMGSYFTTKSEESMNFISLPITMGVKLASHTVNPYLYATCAPSYLTSSKQSVKRKSYSLFLPDSAKYTITSVQDTQTTGNRTRYQVFVGGGAGVEIDYGYGVVYADCGVRVALRETGYLNFTFSETRSRLVIFPVSLGLRFYL